MTPDLILVRHARVADAYQGICYGRSDVPLSPEGRSASLELARQLARLPIRHLVSSPSTRARFLAELVAAQTGLPLTLEPDLQERDFGAWESRTWDAIHAEVGEAMLGLIHEPGTYHPPGGETTLELRDRAVSWYARRPTGGLVVAITHGGPIAAIRGMLAGLPPDQWPGLIPPTGTFVELHAKDEAPACVPEVSEAGTGRGRQ